VEICSSVEESARQLEHWAILRFRLLNGEAVPVLSKTALTAAPADVVTAANEIKVVIAGLPDSFRTHLQTYGGSESEAFDLSRIASAYQHFRAMRADLRQIVESCQDRRTPRPVPATVWLGVDPEGQLVAALPRFYSEVDGIEATQLRICGNPRCRTVFWAGRIDQTGCQPTCQRSIRDRRAYQAKSARLKQESLDNRVRVLDALKHGPKSQSELIKATGFSADKLSELLAALYDQGDANSRGGKFFLTRSARKGK